MTTRDNRPIPIFRIHRGRWHAVGHPSRVPTAARTYLSVIEKEPAAVRRALASERQMKANWDDRRY